MDFHLKVKMGKEKLKRYLAKYNDVPENKPSVINKQNGGVHLPKFQLKSFMVTREIGNCL